MNNCSSQITTHQPPLTPDRILSRDNGKNVKVSTADEVLRRDAAPPAVERLMASKTKAMPQKEEAPEKEAPEAPDTPLPLLDVSDAAVKTLIRSAKKRGYVTHDQINSLSKEINSEQIEDVLAMFSEMRVNVVETEEPSAEGEEPREEPDK